jgi:hypothetical protein
MNNMLHEIAGEIPRDPWELRPPVLAGEYGEAAGEGFASDLGGPFLVGALEEIEGDIQVENPTPEAGALAETPEGPQGAQPSESQETLADEARGGTFTESSTTFDPYAGIRPALSPEYAALTADEISAVLGPRPAIIALYGLLAQPELPRAALALLLGTMGRRSLPLNGADVPIVTYLRLLSRLFREAAEYHEADIGAEVRGAAPIETELQEEPRIHPTSAITPILQLDRIQLGEMNAPFIRNPSGGFQAFFGLSTLPSPMVSLTIRGQVLIDENGKRRAFSKSDGRAWQPIEVVNGVYTTARGPGTTTSTSFLSTVKDDGTFATESVLSVDPGTQRIHVLVKMSLKNGKYITADAIFQRNDLEIFLSVVDKRERASTNTLTRLEFLSSVRKMFQPRPKSSLAAFFDELLYRNRKIPLLVDITTTAGKLIRRFDNMEIGGNPVDIGHVLTGIEGSRRQQPLLGSPSFFHGPILWADDLEATVTWAGDLGLALVSYAEDTVTTRKTLDIRTYLNAHAGLADLIGDIDGINVGVTYDPSQSLADNLRAYYEAKPFRRFSSFVKNAKDSMGKQLFTLTMPRAKLDPAGRTNITHHLSNFAYRKLAFASQISKQQLVNAYPIVKQGSKEIDIIADYFFAFLENGLTREP